MFDSSHNFYNMIQSSDNFLLIKSDLGKTKPGIHKLPPQDFTYGKLTGEDKEGARQLMSQWHVHQSSKKQIPEPNYKLLNSMSVMNGLSTATEFRTFRKEKKLRTATSQMSFTSKVSVPGMTYGMPNQATVPINALISNFYGRVAAEELNQVYAETPVLKGLKFRSTKGFELLKSAKIEEKERNTNREFKMRKFRTVKSRTDCWRPKNK